MNITACLDEMIHIPRPIRGLVAHLLGFSEAERLYDSLIAASPTQSVCERLLDRLAVTFRIAISDLQQIPRTGPVVLVANHPFGILEGAVLATILARIRPDFRFLANQVLSAFPELRGALIPIHMKTGPSTTKRNAQSLRRAIAFLEAGGCVVVFPAGEVSRFSLRERTVTDSTWHTAVARMIDHVSRKNISVSTVPVYIEGVNSPLFQVLGLIHPSFAPCC